MKPSSPQTVDVPAESLSGFTPPIVQQRDLSNAVRKSLGVDFFLIATSLMVGVLFSTAIGAVILPADVISSVGRAFFVPPLWLVMLLCLLPAGLFTMLDSLSATSNPAALPFARSKSSTQAIYASRIHLLLLAFYFTAILAALCWSALSMPLVSKMFVSAIFSFALYALGQSIPSTRMSFIVSGVLFLVVLILTQAFIVLQLESNAGKASKKVLDELTEPRVEQESDSGAFDDSENLP